MPEGIALTLIVREELCNSLATRRSSKTETIKDGQIRDARGVAGRNRFIEGWVCGKLEQEHRKAYEAQTSSRLTGNLSDGCVLNFVSMSGSYSQGSACPPILPAAFGPPPAPPPHPPLPPRDIFFSYSSVLHSRLKSRFTSAWFRGVLSLLGVLLMPGHKCG